MFIRVGHRVINTAAFGSGEPPLFAVAGWIGSWQLWRQPLEILSQDRRCIAYDHRGAGQTLAAPEELTLDGMVDDVFTVMDAMGVDRCWLAGESQGGFIAASAALRDPSRFLGLIVVGSTPYWAPDERKLAFADRLEENLDDALGPFIEAVIPEPDSEHLKRWLLHILKEADSRAGSMVIRQMTVDIRDRLLEIRLPTLVIHGALDRIEKPALAEAFAAGLPNARLLMLEDAGHVPTLTRPLEVAAAIREFIASAED